MITPRMDNWCSQIEKLLIKEQNNSGIKLTLGALHEKPTLKRDKIPKYSAIMSTHTGKKLAVYLILFNDLQTYLVVLSSNVKILTI